MIMLNRLYRRIAAIEGVAAKLEIHRFEYGGYRAETCTCGGCGTTPERAARNAILNLETRRVAEKEDK